MMRSPVRTCRPAAVVALVLSAAGCYEEAAPPPQPAVEQPSRDAAPAGGSETPRPSHGAAQRAAHNTADQVAEQQRQLEKMLEDDE